MDLAVSIDVESTETDIEYKAVDTLVDHLDSIGFPTTLFVTPDVVTAKPETMIQLQEAGHTIGLHIHPERLGYQSKWLDEYSVDEIGSMLDLGCAVFEEYLSFTPRCFRAGRWAHSDALMTALADHGFEVDASVRLSDGRVTDISTTGPITELPLSVYDSRLMKALLIPWDMESIPLTADAFLARWYAIQLFYFATWRLLGTQQPYIMVAYHDYDLTQPDLRERIESYVGWLHRQLLPRTVNELEL